MTVAAVPRLAASVLVVRDDPFEVLMLRRHAAASFASALVFPGGTVDADDGSPDWLDLVEGADRLDQAERALRVAACRELFEEASILLAGDVPAYCLPPSAEARRLVDIVRDAGLRLQLGALEPFGHWLTPAGAAKRFDTRFYLCRAPAGQEAMCDGNETVALEWLSPADALAQASERTILFPTQMNLKRLAESGDSAHALAAAPGHPRVVVTPEVERSERGVTVRIPAEAGYGVTEQFIPAR